MERVDKQIKERGGPVRALAITQGFAVLERKPYLEWVFMVVGRQAGKAQAPPRWLAATPALLLACWLAGWPAASRRLSNK